MGLDGREIKRIKESSFNKKSENNSGLLSNIFGDFISFLISIFGNKTNTSTYSTQKIENDFFEIAATPLEKKISSTEAHTKTPSFDVGDDLYFSQRYKGISRIISPVPLSMHLLILSIRNVLFSFLKQQNPFK